MAMNFIKKLVGGDKPAPDNEQAAKPKAAPQPGQSKEAAARGPRSGYRPEHGAHLKVGSKEEFRRTLQILGREDAASTEQVDLVGEAGGRVKRLEQATEFGGSLGTSEEMLLMLCEQNNLQFIKLADVPKKNFTPQLLGLFSRDFVVQYRIFPVELRPDKTLVVAISDPLNVRIADDLQLFLLGNEVHAVEVVVAREDEIMDYININYGVGDTTLAALVQEFQQQDQSSGLEVTDGVIDISDLDKIANEGPIIKFVNLLLLTVIKDRGSDLHLEPFTSTIRIRYRVDGALREIQAPPKSWQLGIISRLKVMSGLNIAETRRPQDGRLKLTMEGREVDCRVSCLPVVHGESLVMRILDRSMMSVGVQQIGMADDVLGKFMKCVQRPNGIVLVTGPTGSGKTTTLYAALNEVNEPSDKIITTEDPVEYQLEGIVQVSINPAQGLTFAKCLRAILRQDPDTILVGEIRDGETAQIAVQASLTGHLVLSSLHTNSAAATVSRLIDMGVEPFLITSCLEGIVGQRLVRMICPTCRVPYHPTPEELADFGMEPEDVQHLQFWQGEGCDECGHSGYKGRLGLFELLVADDELKAMILDRATTDEIHEYCVNKGMKTMRMDGWEKVRMGVTTFAEVCRHTPRDEPERIQKEMSKVRAALRAEIYGDDYSASDMPSSSTTVSKAPELPPFHGESAQAAPTISLEDIPVPIGELAQQPESPDSSGSHS
jgi:type II secretory ATPase GspE/PulE/Tfp pilus assembly ATPase PilB-like protein